MSPKRYSIYVLVSAIALVASAWALAWWLEPLYGDLTRIGGYAERDYGGNSHILEFSPLAATWSHTYRPTDVLVIGDSFANLRPAQQWQNWLAARTGWTIHTLDKNRLDVDALLSDDLYRRHPPRLVIWNVIERDLLNEYGTGNGNCAPAPPHPKVPALPLYPTVQIPHVADRPLGLANINPDFARSWFWKNLLRSSVGLDYSEARSLTLARQDLFSSKQSDRLLIYTRDLGKAKWRSGDLDRIRCGFNRLVARFEANGKTRFLTALALDKSSAYRPWLADPFTVPVARLPALLNHFPVADARLDQAIDTAIKAGIRDVYMPDDTHWGTAGHILASEAILKMLTKEGLTQ